MRRVAAWTQQQSNPSQYYLDAETAADTGIEYWNNKPLITALIENEIIMKLPQATALNQGIIESVLRPQENHSIARDGNPVSSGQLMVH